MPPTTTRCWRNYSDYRDTVPHLFHHNAVVMFGNGEKAKRMAIDDAFKAEAHPFRIAIVCAMWLTGFDVPSLSTLYLDKPLKAHTLMQAIVRANRVNEGKNNGLIVDYCGILRHLRKALATFAGARPGDGSGDSGEVDPARPAEELLADLAEAIALVRTFLDEGGAPLDDVIGKTGFARNAAIVACKEAANENDETRKRFEVMCREVFRKFRACINVNGVNDHRADRNAIDIVYKSLQRDREQADISDIIRKLHEVVDEAIEVRPNAQAEKQAPYDIPPRVPGVPGGAVALLRARGGGLTAAAEFPAHSKRAASCGFGSRKALVHFSASSSATSVASTSSSVL